MTTVTTYTTCATRAPLATKLPLAYRGTPGVDVTYTYVPVAKLVIDDLQPGDLVQVDAAGEASTVDGIRKAMHGRYLKATTTGSICPSEGILLARAMGTNVTADIHHSMLTASGALVAAAAGPVELIFVMYAASLSGPKNRASLLVDYVELRATATRTREMHAAT
jgi:hypothetical protein